MLALLKELIKCVCKYVQWFVSCQLAPSMKTISDNPPLPRDKEYQAYLLIRTVTLYTCMYMYMYKYMHVILCTYALINTCSTYISSLSPLLSSLSPPPSQIPFPVHTCIHTEAAEIIRSVCLAVGHLHYMNIAHRDLKVSQYQNGMRAWLG